MDVVDDQESSSPEPINRRDILAPAIQSVVAALGGFEDDIYVLGDEAYGCLKDLKKFWRKDDTDDDRTVARIFWETRVLHNDLVPILLQTAGKGQVDHRCAIACLDLITAMTWPIDVSAELMELDEEEEVDKKADYTTLLLSHLHYKAAILSPAVLEAIIGILLPCLAKEKKERSPRDGQIIHVSLYLFRNLAFIKDLPGRTEASADNQELSQLQSKLIVLFKQCNIFDLLLTLASNSTDDALFNSWNTLLLETFYLCFRGIKPATLVTDQARQTSNTLATLLDVEDRFRENLKRTAPTRHSRFGTSITVKSGTGHNWVLHRQAALKGDAGNIIDMTKKKQTKKSKVADQLGTFDTLSYDARVALQEVGATFVESCFNPFLTSLLKDIRAERQKVTEKDNLRLLFVAKWFMEYFLALNTKERNAKHGKTAKWTFDLVADIVERPWIAWMLKRMRGALDDKPKQWTELQAGLECVTQLLLLVDAMSSSGDEELVDAAEALQHQLYYNGEVLELTFESLRTYKEQSLAYLNATVYLAYVLLRMLETWGKTKGEMYVQRKKKSRSRKKGNSNEEQGIVDAVEDPEPETFQSQNIMNESLMTFEKYEAKFADEAIANTLLVYLAQYRNFESPENMKRVVTLLHRQAVRIKAEGLFFKVSTLSLFRGILAEQKMLPREQPYKDLINLINFLLRRFFKAVEEDAFLVIAAFFPKNRGAWKKFSSWEPEVHEKRISESKHDGGGGEFVVSKRFTWSQQVGIAVGCLVESGKQDLVEWTKEILMLTMGQRQRQVDDIDAPNGRDDEDSENDDDASLDKRTKLLRGPSSAAKATLQEYEIPYPTNEKAAAASSNGYLKLLFSLINFEPRDQPSDELQWYVPKELLPDALNASLQTIENYLQDPVDIDGKRPKQLVSKKRKRRVRMSDSDSDEDDAIGDERQKQRRAKKKKEEQFYKSAALIEDSDAELGDDDLFFQKEREQRERYNLKAAEAAEGKSAPRGGNKARKRPGSHHSGATKKKRKTDHSVSNAANSDSDKASEQRAASRRVSRSSSSPSPAPVEKLPPPKGVRPGYVEVDDENDEPSFSRTLRKPVPLFAPDSDDEPVIQTQPRHPRKLFLSDDDE